MDYLDKYNKEIKNISELEKNNDEIVVSRKGVIEFYKEVRELLFFSYYNCQNSNKKVETLIENIHGYFNRFSNNCCENVENNSDFDIFFNQLPHLKSLLMKDVKAIYDGDPACDNYSEVILTYPGFVAISAYRIAHLLYEMDYKFVARVISEYAHSRTGIDINPGAKIGEYFFIDHGTGVVVGETCVIGNNVKVYQGVTLGALSVKKNSQNKKRHPTIEDDVTIYANATILGGETVIGKGSIIGGNTWLTSSVAPGTVVTQPHQDN